MNWLCKEVGVLSTTALQASFLRTFYHSASSTLTSGRINSAASTTTSVVGSSSTNATTGVDQSAISKSESTIISSNKRGLGGKKKKA